MKSDRAAPCTPRTASRLELYGGEKSRNTLDVGDRVDICVDGHGYHWVLVTKIEFDYERVYADRAPPVAPVGPVATPAAATKGSAAVQRIAQRIARSKAEKEARLDALRGAKKAAIAENARRRAELSSRVYYGLLASDPAPACMGCQIGREFIFRHDAVKEVRRGPRGMTIAQAIRNLRRFIEESEHKPRLSADHDAISAELGIQRPLSAGDDEEASKLWVEEDYFASDAPVS